MQSKYEHLDSIVKGTDDEVETQREIDKKLRETPSSNPKYITIQKKHYDITTNIIPNIVDMFWERIKDQSTMKDVFLEDIVLAHLSFGCYSEIKESKLEPVNKNIPDIIKWVAESLVKKIEGVSMVRDIGVSETLLEYVKECVLFAILINNETPTISWIASTKSRYDSQIHEPSNFKLQITRITTPGLQAKDIVIAKAKVEINEKIK